MVNPVPGKQISTPFGIRGRYWSCLKDASGRGIHTGADWAAPAGTQIVAPISGQIRYRSYGKAFGPYQFAISPDPGQPFAQGEVFFAHTLSRPPEGSYVKAGDPIAKVGALGNTTGAHLHMEFMPNTKGVWRCGIHKDPNATDGPVQWNAGGTVHTPKQSTWMFPKGHKVYQKYLRVDGHKLNDDNISDSIKALQECLNKHSMRGGKNIPITGKYWSMTDDEVRLCQRLHMAPEDPVMQSFVGPKQWEHLAEAVDCPYIFVLEPEETKPVQSDKWDGNWSVPRSITKLLTEVNMAWPGRDKSSDGTIGDAAHSKSKSEHNPVGHPFGPEFGTKGSVHAVDITANGIDTKRVLNSLIGDLRVWYVIHDGHIWSKTYDWAKRPYNGSNPHKSHIHMSLAADTQALAIESEMNAKSWGILDSSVDEDLDNISPGDVEALRTELIGIVDQLFTILNRALGR